MTDNIFTCEADAIVNPVNCIGVHWKGLAKDFANRFPAECEEFSNRCLRGIITTGRVMVVSRIEQPKYIIFFPTKMHWRDPSQINYIKTGLADLESVVYVSKIKSIAIPALGCGLGGLKWTEVEPILQRSAKRMEHFGCRVRIFSPRDSQSQT